MKLTFWLLDINSETKEGKPEIWMWGVDSHGERVLIIDRSFVPYFYVVTEENANPSKVEDEIKRQFGDAAVKLEVVSRQYFGKPVEAVRVSCYEPTKLAKRLRSLEGLKDCLEDDIRPAMRYLIDNNVVPCSWHEVEVASEDNRDGVRVSKVHRAQLPPKVLDKPERPSLRVLNFYMTCYSREGSPKPERNPVVIISTVTDKGEERQFLADESKNDRALLEEFTTYVQKLDPDIITGYDTNTVDWSYLKDRCRKLKLKLRIDRACTEPHTSVYGHVSLTGMANLDLKDFADQFPDVKVQTLENLADHLGIMKLSERNLIWDVDFPEYWDDKLRRSDLKKFAADNALCVKGITNAVLDFALQLSSLVSLPLDHVMTAAVGFRIEWFLIKHAQKIGELIPKRIEQPYRPYAGGLVLKPSPGLHESIAVLDFKSMYPNLMITYNLSPDTYISPTEEEPLSGVFVTPELGYKFRKEPPGFYKEVLTYLINARSEIRARMKGLSGASVEYRVLDARQKAVKVITNAAYGYAGWIGARWYNKPVAEAATAWGRYTIQTAIDLAQKAGLRVIYGDTDSLFTTYDKDKTPKLEKDIEKELGLEVESDKRYVRIFFTEAKKRYAGLMPDGTIDIVGLEVIRGDWAEVAKKVQEHVLEIVLKEQSPEKAKDYVLSEIAKLRARKAPFRDLVIWKTLTKPIEEYAVKASHVEVARILESKGWKMTIGDKVGYVVLKGEGRLYTRAKPYMYASYDEVDVEYYVTNQVVPAATRVLSFFDINDEDLLKAEKKETKSKSLMEFVGTSSA